MDVQKEKDAVTAVIERWVAAIRSSDLDGVVADHTGDIVMFDVPPPQRGLRGMDDYRACWPPFFRYIESGTTFEIVELDVTCGEDVAFGWMLLRCGPAEELERKPDLRLRITVGLRREAGRWQISHEHHSFPLDDQ
ncbi:SgcJ/EcaC family oxidoreductase [Actinoplanes sp. NPDC051861]|uniref:YybH family protein n=1 Tax=Actinoplanes sp. NPDC051861 TaxID=3155170 RepID=UPI00341ECFF9